MRMELIQPFINAADAVLAQTMQAPPQVGDVSMDEETYRRKGLAAIVEITGEIEGRVIVDMEPPVASRVLQQLGSDAEPTDEMLPEAVCELANLVIGNAVTALNDQGFRFKVHPPARHAQEAGLAGSEDTEALVMCFTTDHGAVYVNVAMRYHRRRKSERSSE
ncbi:MAG TPA: chemotaxis protein CheX [Terriglobales bacterium]|nr:chemotaxis protein CheX [Terriglobales bacterium]